MRKPKTKYYWVLVDKYGRYAQVSDGGTFLFPTREIGSAFFFHQKRNADNWIKIEGERTGKGDRFLETCRVVITVV